MQLYLRSQNFTDAAIVYWNVYIQVKVDHFVAFSLKEPTAVCLPYISWTAWLQFLNTVVFIPQ